MTTTHVHPPGTGKPKNSTQIISMFVGGLLFILGLCGLLFSSFAGLHMSIFHSIVIAVSGIILLFQGYKNNSRHAFKTCLGFSIFFGLHALAGFLLGEPGVPQVGYAKPDDSLLRIIPNFQELGTTDHILNAVIAAVLMGGAIDWWRRKSKREQRRVQRDIKRRTHGTEPLHH